MLKTIIKRAIVSFAAILLLSILPAAIYAAPRIRIDGEFIPISDQGVIVIEGRALVPLRVVMESLNFDVNWDNKSQTTTLSNQKYNIKTQIGNRVIRANHGNALLDSSPAIINERTMVSLYTISKVSGARAEWDEHNMVIDIKSASEAILDSVSESRTLFYASNTEFMLSPAYAEAIRQEFYSLINEYRRANGLRELEVNLELQSYADIRASELRIKYSHTRPDGSPAGSGWHNSTNMLNSRFAENAIYQTSFTMNPRNFAVTVFTDWKNSPSHNLHMLWDFDYHITMAFGIYPVLNARGNVDSTAVFATGF